MECHVGGFEYDKDLLESWGRDAVTTRLRECAQTGKMRKEAHVETFQEKERGTSDLLAGRKEDGEGNLGSHFGRYLPWWRAMSRGPGAMWTAASLKGRQAEQLVHRV